ncbi:hypothetical protein [Halobacterium wangiae]|uniref:hypothetical protein n=1 Tax=Halobacterium wangiae TaxID=2902623 RepID=UPI001E5C635E|nr:hypothetical protein [Halobacterium wangiae]
MNVGGGLLWAAAGVDLLVLVGALLVTWKATVAYRQSGSRSMLLLAVGLFLLLVVAEVVAVAGGVFVESGPAREGSAAIAFGVLGLLEGGVRLCGVAALVGSLYVRE